MLIEDQVPTIAGLQTFVSLVYLATTNVSQAKTFRPTMAVTHVHAHLLVSSVRRHVHDSLANLNRKTRQNVKPMMTATMASNVIPFLGAIRVFAMMKARALAIVTDPRLWCACPRNPQTTNVHQANHSRPTMAATLAHVLRAVE